jgi:hypothetical protein
LLIEDGFFGTIGIKIGGLHVSVSLVGLIERFAVLVRDFQCQVARLCRIVWFLIVFF